MSFLVLILHPRMMFECRVCVSRILRAIVGDHQLLLRRVPARQLAPPLSYTPRRSKTSLTTARETATAYERAGALNRYRNGTGTRAVSVTEEDMRKPLTIDKRALQTELQYLDDPLKLAEHVHYTLRCRNAEKALELCRMASKKQNAVVSWNHCIDWHMKQGMFNSALKIFNEMKKRAQFPDSHTYTILLRGLASKGVDASPETKKANVARAVSLYNSLSSPTSRVRPNILHTNAVLTVCAEAQDMDALWGIVGKMPRSGPFAADHITYAIILNALRHGAFPDGESEGIYFEQIGARRIEVVQQGRKIWLEIIRRWRNGDLIIDEKLVVAMARLLLFSRRLEDWDDVLSLVQQTMNITRQIDVIGTPGRNTLHIPKPVDDAAQADPESDEGHSAYKDTSISRAFDPLKLSSGERSKDMMFIQPGNPTLSLLIGTCTLLRVPKAASEYWAFLTRSVAKGGFGLQPDLPNFHAQLRLLGMNRSSAKAAALLKEDLSASGLRPTAQTFRIALSVCQRDIKNANAVVHAGQMVDVMHTMLSEPDVQSLETYLHIALGTNDGPSIVKALDRLDLFIHNLKSLVSYGPDTRVSGGGRFSKHVIEKQEILEFIQAVVGAIDTLMSRGLVPREDFVHWHGRRSLLIAFLGRQRKVVGRQKTSLQKISDRRRSETRPEKEWNEDWNRLAE